MKRNDRHKKFKLIQLWVKKAAKTRLITIKKDILQWNHLQKTHYEIKTCCFCVPPSLFLFNKKQKVSKRKQSNIITHNSAPNLTLWKHDGPTMHLCSPETQLTPWLTPGLEFKVTDRDQSGAEMFYYNDDPLWPRLKKERFIIMDQDSIGESA